MDVMEKHERRMRQKIEPTMSQLGQPNKKIVSKSKYVQVQSLRAGIGLAGVCLIFAAASCASVTIVTFLEFLRQPDWHLKNYGGIAFPRVLGQCGGAMLMGVGVYKMYRMSVASFTRARKMNHVVPLTKANAPYLPAQESLVRASAEPSAMLETVLLRAAADNPTTPPEQLVRASNTPA
jgi:hypothetical protein